MTAKKLLDTIIERKMQITPVLDKKGNVHHWTAGFKIVHIHSKGLVPNDGFAEGRSIEEAVTKLIQGQTVFKTEPNSEGSVGLIEHPENKVDRWFV